MNSVNISNAYLDYLHPKTRELETFDAMGDMIASLQMAVSAVGGNPSTFQPRNLSEMSALDLIAALAPNGVLFTVKEPEIIDEDEEKEETSLWNFAPYWAVYAARDESGVWFFYEDKPNLGTNEWEATEVDGRAVTFNESAFDHSPGGIVHWANTLIKRPCEEKEETSVWDFAPNWAKWLARDESGVWFFYEDKPHPGTNEWETAGENRLMRSVAFNEPAFHHLPCGIVHWANTLIKRPCEESHCPPSNLR